MALQNALEVNMDYGPHSSLALQHDSVLMERTQLSWEDYGCWKVTGWEMFHTALSGRVQG